MCHPKNLFTLEFKYKPQNFILSQFWPISQIKPEDGIDFVRMIASLTQKMIDESQIKSGYGLQFCQFENRLLFDYWLFSRMVRAS